MLVDSNLLKWCGMDMRPRWRRRVAVLITYAAFLVAVWAPASRSYDVLLPLFYISLLFQPSLLKDIGVLARLITITVVTLLIAMFVFHSDRLWQTHHEGFAAPGAFALTLLVTKSVVGWGKLVDNGNRGWMAKAIRKGDTASWWQKRRLARRGFAVGLEGFAWYEYTLKYRQLSKDQKAEIEALHRANPRGKWMRQQAHVLFDDERLQNEEAQLRVRVQRATSWVLVGAAFVCSIVLADGRAVGASVVISSLWTLAAMVTTLRQAIPLWSEEDPRTVVGEIAVVDVAHA